MNINKEKMAIDDNILDIYQQENQNDTFGCVMCKKNSTYKRCVWVVRRNEGPGYLLGLDFRLY